MADVLVVEDKESLRTALRKTLESRGYSVEDAADVYEARRRLQSTRFLAVLTDLRLPAGSGFDVLQAAREVDAQSAVVVMTAFGGVEEAVRAMKEGATDFLTKPVDTDHLLLVIERAVERRRLMCENVILREEYQRRFALPRVIGDSPALTDTIRAVQRAAQTDTTVLLTGESGTGKELLARSLHQLSPRAGGPFVAINCAAIPDALLENELFGHEKGAFTGAGARKLGKAELAHRGTLFLDEIGDLTPTLQGKLLRLLQERQFERVGGLQTQNVDLRIVAATNRDLRAAVAERAFREDLFFRLSVFPIEVPPLRRRRGDIPILAAAFLEKFGGETGRRGMTFSRDALRTLMEHAWPGNVRELQNCVERAVIVSDGPEIRPEHLRLDEAARERPRLADVVDLTGPLNETLERVRQRAEDEAIEIALEEAGGRRPEAADRLGISLSTLNRRLKALGGDRD